MNFKEIFNKFVVDNIKKINFQNLKNIDAESIEKSLIEFWKSRSSRKMFYFTVGIVLATLLLHFFGITEIPKEPVENAKLPKVVVPAVIKKIKAAQAKIEFEVLEKETKFPKFKIAASIPLEKEETNLTIQDCLRCGVLLSITPIEETIASNEKFLGFGKLYAITDFESFEDNNLNTVIDTKGLGPKFTGLPTGEYKIEITVAGRDPRSDKKSSNTEFLGGLNNNDYKIELGKKDDFLNRKVDELSQKLIELYRIALAESDTLQIDAAFEKNEKELNAAIYETSKTWPQVNESLQNLADSLEPALILHSAILLKPDHNDPLLKDLTFSAQKGLSAYLDQKSK